MRRDLLYTDGMKKLLKNASTVSGVIGIALLLAGCGGVAYTYQNVARENIVTPADASIPNAPVRGPLTLKSQAEIIREHTLKTTGGKTYAEMPREDKNRPMWITATTLTTALNFGILAYAFSAFVAFEGLAFLLTAVFLRRAARLS